MKNTIKTLKTIAANTVEYIFDRYFTGVAVTPQQKTINHLDFCSFDCREAVKALKNIRSIQDIEDAVEAVEAAQERLTWAKEQLDVLQDSCRSKVILDLLEDKI